MAMMNQLTVDELAEFEVAYAPPYSHPKYFNKDNRQLIRAAAVGKQGADKRIDILSMAMMN
ncbi:hypothetical protein BUE67_15750, partial [Corynebacterium diphtheriae]